MSDSYTVCVVGALPEAFDVDGFESGFDVVTLKYGLDPAAASFDSTVDCVLASRGAVTATFDPASVAAPVLLIAEDDDGLAEIALSVGVADYLAVRGTEAEATWLAYRVRTAADSYRTDRKRARLDRQQQALSDLGAFALSGPAREEVFDETVRCVSEALGVDRVALFRSRAERGDLSVVAAEGWPQAYVGGVAVGLDSGPGRALAERRSVVENDLSGGATALTANFDARSELNVVVGGANEPWGVLSVHSPSPGAFDETDARFVENVAALIAAVLERETLRTTLEETFVRMDQGLLGVDEEWRVTYANPEAERLLDRARRDLVGEQLWEVFGEESEPLRDRYEKALRTGEKASFEWYYPPHDRWYEMEAYPSSAGLSIYFADVTDRVEREMELLRYERMVEAATDGVYALDADQYVVQANEAFAEMFDWDPEELIGTHASELIGAVAAEAGAQVRREAGETSEPQRMEFEVELDGGGEMWVETHFSAIVEEETGQFVGTVGVTRDVTDRRHRERSLTTLHEWTREIAQAEDAGDVVDRALEASHELFEPCRAAFFDYEAAARRLVRREGSDRLHGRESVDPGEDPCWVAFTEERTTRTEAEGDVVEFAPVGQYGVLAVERTAESTPLETDREVLRLLAATTSELLGSVEAKEALRDRDQRLGQQNERLTQLNRINRTVRGVTRSVVHAATMEEATARACERLVEAEPYQFAWLCEYRESAAEDEPSITPVTTAGVEDGYAARLPEVARTTPFPELLSQVASTGRRAVVDDVLNDPAWEPHRRDALSRGFRSLAVVPAGEDRLLVVHGTRPETFVGEDGDVLVELGETLGAVIDQLGRSRPVFGNQQTEVELEIRDDRQFLIRLSEATGHPATVTGVVPTTEGEYRAFVRTVAPREAAAEALPAGTVVRELTDEDDEEHLYEIRPSDTTPFETLYAERGRLHEMRADGGVCTVTLTIPSDVSVRSVVEAFDAVHPGTSLAARRTVTETPETRQGFRARLDEVWTERQREAISAALHGGLYQWPRKTSVSTLAEAFDISSPTFQYHLRAAERKLLELVLE
ncbi:bacterio-opsin activator domain-containing protein [Halogeometricum luteum]|uniref:PAS domain-containing protein n=1 Tax=Halogeometricum luteum TaxID=2950537 RepID=A0ABU2G158_9EURY|nr:bacterio-opsin activator domain-containing protein [Halogeometricum sp. S3BR5-2]MDS0294034.1 PAS domain-containing protein [Halogeometricum sp. S3BR5-2]